MYITSNLQSYAEFNQLSLSATTRPGQAAPFSLVQCVLLNITIDPTIIKYCDTASPHTTMLSASSTSSFSFSA